MGERVSSQPSWLAHFDVGDAFEALQADRSRLVLRALDAAGGRSSLADLVDAILAREEATSADPAPDGQTERGRVLIDLHHVTLPRLDGYGIVTYDTETNLVVLEPAGESLLPLVEHADYVETRR